MSIKFQPRYSLLTLLFVMTIVALATVVWNLNRQIISLRKRTTTLEQENYILRTRRGSPWIKDESMLNVVWTDPNTRMQGRERVWKVWVPEGLEYELHIATGWYSKDQFPSESPKGPIILKPGEHYVRTTMMNFGQIPRWHLQLATENDKRALNAMWLRWKGMKHKSSGVRKFPEVSKANQPFLLWRYNVENSNTGEKDGMIVWLQSVDN